jgi:hypothetical protein
LRISGYIYFILYFTFWDQQTKQVPPTKRSKIDDYFKRKRDQTLYTPSRRIFSYDASSDASIPSWIQQQSSSEGSNGQDTRIAPANEQDQPPHTLLHRISSYDASSSASVRKDRIPEDGIPEDGLLIESHDIAIDCKLTVNNVCVRSKMEQWRCKSKYIEEIHKQEYVYLLSFLH